MSPRIIVAGLICLFLSTILTWQDSAAQLIDVPPFQNATVGQANGPQGRSNIQTMADFEDGVLHTINNKDEDDYYFVERPDYFELALASGGAKGSATSLKISQTAGAYPDGSTWRYIQMFWAGPRKGKEGFIKYARRANAHSVMVRAFDALAGDQRQNVVIGGYAKRRTPHNLAISNPESDNMHNYFQMKVDWGGGVWRELLVRNNPTHQRSEKHHGGFEAFLDNAELWPDHTRLYWDFQAGSPDVGPGDIYMDDFIWFYENPFLAGYPQVSRRRTTVGNTAVHPIVIWNTHPSATRNFNVRLSGYASNAASATANVQWWKGSSEIKDGAGLPISETGPLGPGDSFVFYVHHRLPAADVNNHPLGEGSFGTILLSVFERAADIADAYPYQRANPVKNMIDGRYDLQGIGFVIRTSYVGTVTPAAEAQAVRQLDIEAVGGTWADLQWISPASSQDERERSTDPAAMAYAIRYSTAPITDPAEWNAAVPVESAPPVFGPDITQRYSLRGLNINTRYFVAVRCYNEDNYPSPIASVSFTTEGADVDLGKGDSGGVPDNEAPLVDAGEDQSAGLNDEVLLSGSVSDDGLPSAPAELQVRWFKESGPGAVDFDDEFAPQTSVRFSEPGSYVLQLTADDGALASSDNVSVVVAAEDNEIVLVDFGASAKENSFGLEGWSTVLLDRLTGYTNRGPGGVTIRIGRNRRYNFQGVTGQPREFGLGERIEVSWYNAAKKTIRFTPRISFDDPDRIGKGHRGSWHAMTRLTLPPGTSGVSSFTIDGTSVGAYRLVNVNVNYNNRRQLIADKISLLLPEGNQIPWVEVGADQIISLPAVATLTGRAVDDGLPAVPGELALSWDLEEGPGEVIFSAPHSLSTDVEFSAPGIYLLQLTAHDGELLNFANIQVEVLPANAYLLVDFGSNAASNLFGLPGWNEVLKDKHTNYVNAGPDGMAIVRGKNRRYNYQGVRGNIRNFVEGEHVLVRWYNAGKKTISFRPLISFDDPDRRSTGKKGKWYEMSDLTLAAGAMGVSSYSIDDLSAGSYRLVNINNNVNNRRSIVADRIVLDSRDVADRDKRSLPVVERATVSGVAALGGVFPNPFQGETRIAIHLQQPAIVSLQICDVLGRPVRTLVESELMNDDLFVNWDGADAAGAALPPGLYFVRLQTNQQIETREIVVLQ